MIKEIHKKFISVKPIFKLHIGADMMAVYFNNKNGVTADCNRVIPGMVFIDFTHKRNRKDIIAAYKKGASVIYSCKNISDPDLPVIKIDNLKNKLIELLDSYFDNIRDKISLIAVRGSSSEDRFISDLLQKIFSMHFNNCITDDLPRLNFCKSLTKDLNLALNIEYTYIFLNELIKNNIFLGAVNIDIDFEDKFYFDTFKFDSFILTGLQENYANNESKSRNLLNKITYLIQKTQSLIIVNSDYVDDLKTLGNNKNAIVISYGLNKKATATASSINFGETSSFNYCLQRGFKTKSGNLIEPFEMPINFKAFGNSHIYGALAAITCALYYDINIGTIKQVLHDYEMNLKRQFQIIYSNKYSIIDNFCITLNDYNNSFEWSQLLNYKNLYVIIAIDTKANIEKHKNIAEIISEWAAAANIKKIIFTPCFDIQEGVSFISKRQFKIYENMLKVKNLEVLYYNYFRSAIEYVSRKAEEGDVVFMLGGYELDSADDVVREVLMN